MIYLAKISRVRPFARPARQAVPDRTLLVEPSRLSAPYQMSLVVYKYELTRRGKLVTC